MKNLTEYLMEAEDSVYVVYNDTDEILSVHNTKAEADEEVKKWKDEDSHNIRIVKKEKRSDYVKSQAN